MIEVWRVLVQLLLCIKREVMVGMASWPIRFEQEDYLRRNIYPYLVHGTHGSDMWIIDRDGAGVTINSFYAKHILNFAPFDCVLVPGFWVQSPS